MSAITDHTATTPRGSGRVPRKRPNTKVAAATLAAAIASIAFILVAKLAPSAFSDAELATL